MLILPVLDLKEGVVVRGVAGRRSQYRPVMSGLTVSAEPLAVARAIRDRFSLAELYLADLDAIAGAAPAMPVCARLRAAGFRLWMDAGIRRADEIELLVRSGIERVVIGLETIAGPEELDAACRRWGGERIAFSLDLREGRPLGQRAAWGTDQPHAIAARAAAAGIKYLVVLDLARVGLGAGTGTEALCRDLAAQNPSLWLVAGGGVRDRDDLDRLEALGVRAALVASALHDGRLQPQAVTSVPSPGPRTSDP
jgi:phosphoribosylformimino-5-aminoimidazole carboxamide ribotide isomerase